MNLSFFICNSVIKAFPFPFLGMVIDMPGSTLEIRSMALEYTTLPMATATRAHGMKAEGRVSEHTRSVVVK